MSCIREPADPASLPNQVEVVRSAVEAAAGTIADALPESRVGIDLQPIAEVARSVAEYGQRYLTRLFTRGELADSGYPQAPAAAVAERLAARFAAKEAVLKALRPTAEVPAWTEMEVVTGPQGAPRLVLHGAAERLAMAADLHRSVISLSHAGGFAVAIVVLGTFEGPGRGAFVAPLER